MERQTKTSADIPKWSALLVEAVNKPGLIMKAYSAFHSYSLGNQLLALVQCQIRGLQPGPINTFPKWKDLGRYVKRGERALILCMPITRKRSNEHNNDESDGEGTFTSFVYKARWFTLSQTEGDDFPPQVITEWDAKRALAALGIDQIPFDSIDGNCQGFARKRQIAINPVAQLPHKTLFHELAHVVIGHTAEADFADTEKTPRNLREVEAEAVALLCCESLELEGADYCRGYLQNWLYQGIGFDASSIPEKSAQKIFRAADQILRAGHPAQDEAARD
ncbi:MAG: ImmA/IrrE family metallo-endopeptidase [Acidobacteriota bacterium]|nr:ImmA/IrrE family metallo-endopeptidase [Acidobacteriota bacterium]